MVLLTLLYFLIGSRERLIVKEKSICSKAIYFSRFRMNLAFSDWNFSILLIPSKLFFFFKTKNIFHNLVPNIIFFNMKI